MHTVLKALLAEQVPIRDHVRIFEALTEQAKVSKDLDGLVEAARRALGPAVSAQYIKHDRLYVFTLQPTLETALLEAVRPSDRGQILALPNDRLDTLVGSASALLQAAEAQGITPVLVCSPQVRGPLAKLMNQVIPRLPVISYDEVSRSGQIETMGVIGA